MVPAFLCSLYLTFYKTDISLWRTTSAGPKGVRLRESQLYLSCLSAFFFFHLFSQGPFSTFHIQNDPNIEWTGVKFSSDGKMILLSASGGVIHLIDAFQGTQLHTFTVSKVKKAIIGFLAFISIIIFFVNDIWNKSCMNCGNEMKWKWRNDRRSEHNLCNCVKKLEIKIQDFNRVWTRELAIPVRCSTNWPMKPPTLGAGQLVNQFHMWIEILF